jgi:hypothetical protein
MIATLITGGGEDAWESKVSGSPDITHLSKVEQDAILFHINRLLVQLKAAAE